MLSLEARASDDETLESEASIGTADSSENLNVESEGTTSDFCGMSLHRKQTHLSVCNVFMYHLGKKMVERILSYHFLAERLTSPWPQRPDRKSPRRPALRRQPDSLDSVDSCFSVSSYSSSSHFHPSSPSSSATSRRFRFHTKSPSLGSGPAQPSSAPQACQSDSLESSPTGDLESMDGDRPQFTSRGTFSPEKGKQKLKSTKHSILRHSREGVAHGSDSPDIPQQVVMYGSGEFMV